MCGIVGYVGPKAAQPFLLAALRRLEYRGYDSAGISLGQGSTIRTFKKKGRLKHLEAELAKEGHQLSARAGIGHTRWATHGPATDENAHPHSSEDGRFSLVHNGIIENHQDLRDRLEAQGHLFRSTTDSEVILHLLEEEEGANMQETLKRTLPLLRGSFALCILSSEDPDTIYAACYRSPLLVALLDEGYLLASDRTAVLDRGREYLRLEEGQIAIVDPEGYHLYDFSFRPLKKTVQHMVGDSALVDRGHFDHYMIKEIHQIPQVTRRTMAHLPSFDLPESRLEKLDKVVILACGTANHAGRIGRTLLEGILGLPVAVDVASEFRYMDMRIDFGTLALAISQSGETADTLHACRKAKRQGAYLLGISSASDSMLGQICDRLLIGQAGPEMAVASTKAYVNQLHYIYLLFLYLGEKKGLLSANFVDETLHELAGLPEKMEQMLAEKERIYDLAAQVYQEEHAYFMGRQMDYVSALEGALKLKEVSYIHAEAHPAGELKHGSLALIQTGSPVVALVTQEETKLKMEANMAEVASRGGRVLGVYRPSLLPSSYNPASTYILPEVSQLLAPFLLALVLQLFAYRVSVLRGLDVDRPRNLAKSVTVE